MMGKYLNEVFGRLTHTFNFLVFLDLYLSLRNPFKPRQSRTKWYYLFAAIMAAELALEFSYYKPNKPGFKAEILLSEQIVTIVLMSLCVLSTFFVI